jgi:hypothetical protein
MPNSNIIPPEKYQDTILHEIYHPIHGRMVFDWCHGDWNNKPPKGSIYVGPVTSPAEVEALRIANKRWREMLESLLESIVASGVYQELEAGCEGHGPVIEAFELLGEDLPLPIVQWLAEDESP